MLVDFSFRRSPKYRVATISGKVPWSESSLRAAFRQLKVWARDNRVRTGKWFILSRGRKTWEAGVEIVRPMRGNGAIHVMMLPATMVASITFDPEKISARVIYHGLLDWLKWRRKAKEISSVGYTREIYSDDPWSNRRAWSRATIEYIVRK